MQQMGQMQGMLSDYIGVKEEQKEFETFKANATDAQAELPV